MNIFLICMGGSGSKAAEAFVHMAALDMWGAANFHILMVDVDSGNGNHEQAKDVVQLYGDIHAMGVDKHLFSASITLYDWTPGIPLNNLRSLQQVAGLKSDLLARFLYSQQERAMNVGDGFKGHPNIGVLFMQQIMLQHDPQSDDGLALFMNAVKRYGPDRIMVIGSCYGGTGASCIPILGRYLRQTLGDMVALGLLAILPSFSLQKNSKDPIDPDSDDFPNRVKTVLSTYIEQSILTYGTQVSGAPVQRDLYEKIYLLGSPNLISFKKYAPGNSSQRNPATFFDWFACGAVMDYIHQSDAKAQGVYTAWLDQGAWDWRMFSDDAFPRMQINAAKLMSAMGLYLAELHQPVQALLSPNDKQKENMLEKFFSNVGKDHYSALCKSLNRFAQYCALLQLWFYQIITTLPIPEEIFCAMAGNGHQQGLKPADLEKKIKSLEVPLSKEEAQSVIRLYCQKFFSPPALLRMEKMRQQYWPRGNESDAVDPHDGHDLLEVYYEIFINGMGEDEEKLLGVLLPRIVVGPYEKGATSDRLIGMMYAFGNYEGDGETAAKDLLIRLFKALDFIGGRVHYA